MPTNRSQNVLQSLAELLGVFIERDRRLEGLEVEEIDRIGQLTHKRRDTAPVDQRRQVVDLMLDLEHRNSLFLIRKTADLVNEQLYVYFQ